MIREGSIVAGRFEVESRAGSGASAVVWRAYDRESSATVALKVMGRSAVHPEKPEKLERFEREARLLAELHHEAIVGYIAHGRTRDDGDEEHWLATEWLDGETLADRLARQRLGIGETRRLGAAVAGALAAAHARGVIHRDVKPSNLFLQGGDVGAVKVLDFGVAWLETLPGTGSAATQIVGTPGYMAPEQARGEGEIDARADLFSLGCVLWECLAARPPFRAPNVIAVLAKIVLEEVPPVRDERPDAPPELADLVDRLLAKDPAARPPDAATVAAALSAPTRDGAARSTPSAPPSAPPPVGGAEQRVVSVILASAPRGSDGRERARRVREVLAAHGVQVEHLADGAIVATLAGRGTATDRATAAARAALLVRRAVPEGPLVLATGRGMVGRGAPIGAVIDRAAKLLRAGGDRRGVRIDEVTAGLLDSRFEVRGGREGLVLEAEHPPVDTTRRLLGRPTTTVGRDRDLATLEAVLHESIEESVARVALVIGAPGMGKSRLRWEVLRRLEKRGDRAQVWLGRGDPLRAGSPFGLLGDALRRAFGLPDGEPPEASRAKLRARIGRVFGGEDVARVAAFLGEMIGVRFPDEASVQLVAARRDPILMGDRVREAWEDLIVAETAAAPVVLVLDDLHWSDAPTLAAVEAALRACAQRPLFVLALGRPEVQQNHPQLWARHPVTLLRLGELPPRACARLVREVLGDAVEEATVARIVERAAGNAFYLEELVRAVADGTGAATAATMPETVLAMVQARLEALHADLRRTLRAASVFGDVFWRGGVEALLDPADRAQVPQWLALLCDREMVSRRAQGKLAAEDELVFRHALVREAAYAMLPDGDRLAAHRRAGEWLLEHGEHEPIVLADHFERGGAPALAAAHHLRAAEEALAANDFDAAIARARRGAALASGETLGALCLVEAEARRWRGEQDEAAERARAAVSLLVPGSRLWYRAVEESASSSGRRGAYGEVTEWAVAALGAPVSAGAELARTLCLCTIGRQTFHAGRYDLAARVLAEVDSLAEANAPLDPSVAAQVHGLRAAHARHHGDLAGDLAGYQAVLAACIAAGDQRNACNTRVSVGFALLELGETDTAERELRQALEDAEHLGLSAIATRARQNLGLALSMRGELDEAALLVLRTIEESRSQLNKRFEGWTRIYLARILLERGDTERSAAEAEHAADQLSVTPPARAGALAALARARIAQNRAGAALAAAREAHRVLLELGGIEEFEALVRLAWAESLHATGDAPGAASAIDEARRCLLARAERIGDMRLRASFLSHVPENARTLELASRWRIS